MKRVSLILLTVIVVIGSLAWWNRIDLMLAVINLASAPDVAPHRAVNWQQGPDATDGTARPPNIVLILADDLGYNDISTFGGGVAGGRVQTPGIDQLAAEGAVFHQSYSGTATCAPSRAMLLTGRYPPEPDSSSHQPLPVCVPWFAWCEILSNTVTLFPSGALKSPGTYRRMNSKGCRPQR